MREHKKTLIAGASILTGVLVWALTRKRDKPSPPTYTCPYCGETFQTYEALLAHVEAEHPSQPPPELGNIWGYIKDATSGARIAGASVYMDGIFETTSDANGMYGTSHVLWGTHTIAVQADNYEDKTIEVTTEAESTQLEILMDPVPVEPTDWTEGIQIQKITVTPETLYLGTTVEIGVYIQYPDPLPLPADIDGTLIVNGTTLTGDWTITYRNPTLKFSHTPAGIGTYTVKALDKSAHFTVLQDTVNSYYCPWGGVRMPVCVQVTIPDVEPFDIYQQKFEGGDYVVDGFTELQVVNVPQLIEGLQKAYPSKWNPPDAVVRNWVTRYRTWYGTWFSPSGAGLLVMATDHDCREYWDSKEELAEMIARGLGGMGIAIPDEWKLQYGTRVDLLRGLRDCVYPIRYYSLCGGGSCMPRLYCPYCDKGFDGPSHVRARPWDKESFVRSFLTHIETKHPNHPLTEPAWF